MAEHGDVMALTVTAVTTIPAHHIVRFSAARQCNVASDAAAAFSVGAMGVAQYAANSGDHVAVGYLGESKVVAGGSVTAGVMITTNGSGRATAAGSGDIAIGRAMTAAGANGEVLNALLFPAFRLSGAV